MTTVKFRNGMRHKGKTAIVAMLFGIVTLCHGIQYMQVQVSDKDKLGMALDYFQSGKYHEALLLFKKLSSSYALNPRFKAYMGVCCYYEPDYKNACRHFSEAIPQIESFAPHERSVYYYMAAQSFFYSEKYEKAVPLYEKTLSVCYDNEKGDALFGLASCYEKMDSTSTATEYFNSARAYYKCFNDTLAKRRNMAKIDSVLTKNDIAE